MKDKTKFTKKEIIVVLGCVVFLVLNLGAFDERGRGHAKKLVCLTNVRQLAHVWLLYAHDNDDKLVNGATGFSNMNMSWGDHTNELAWVGKCWADDYRTGGQLPPEQQIEQIKSPNGAFWPYVKDLNIYRCPSALRGERLTYSIMFSMNAVCHAEVQGVPGTHVKKLTEIQDPKQRLVFIDEGRITPDAFAVNYNKELWWDGPGIRHSDGTTVSFADGHSEHWKWKGIETVRNGWEIERNGPSNWRPETELGFQDLYRMQRDCWGKLGYEPSY